MADIPSMPVTCDSAEIAIAGNVISAKLDRFADMIRRKDRGLIDELWSDGGFCLVGSEAGEICPTRETVEAKLEAIFTNPVTLILEIPRRRIRLAGTAGWIFGEGILRRRDETGGEETRQYLMLCIFENVAGAWHWRQFFGSEPT
jgi:hypothetical protein